MAAILMIDDEQAILELLKNGLNCPKCGRKYREGENGLTEVKD